jgi:hypothetical protein
MYNFVIRNYVIIFLSSPPLQRKEYGPYISLYTCMLILLFDGVACVFLVVAAVGC